MTEITTAGWMGFASSGFSQRATAYAPTSSTRSPIVWPRGWKYAPNMQMRTSPRPMSTCPSGSGRTKAP